MEHPSPHPELGGDCALEILMMRSRAGFFTGAATVTTLRLEGVGNSVADADKTPPTTRDAAMRDTLRECLIIMDRHPVLSSSRLWGATTA
jgi:hypothetical protein